MHYRLLNCTLVCNFYEGIMIFLGKVRRDENINDYFIEKCFAVLCFTVFKTLNERNMFGRDFPLFTKAEDVNARTCPDRRKKIFKGGRG